MSSRWRAWLGRAGMLVLATTLVAFASLGCFPTVQLGRDDEGGAPTGSSSGVQEADTTGGPGTSMTSGPADASTTAQADGGHGGTGMGTGVGPDTGMGPGTRGSTGATTSSDTGAVWCEVQETDNACLQCARQSCCAELDLCADQVPCNCFIDCLGLGPMPNAEQCQMQCGGSSGIAALQVCLALACPGTCDAM